MHQPLTKLMLFISTCVKFIIARILAYSLTNPHLNFKHNKTVDDNR